MKSRNGAVLIMVLLIMAVVVAGVMAIERWASENYNYAENLYVDNQGAFYMHSAIKVVKRLLIDDNNKYDSPEDTWANLPVFKVNNDTSISVKVEPLNAKININNIVGKDLKLVVRTQEAIQKILEANGANPPQYFKSLLEWIKYKPSNPQQYAFGYHPTGQPFFSLKEIDFAKGMSNFSASYHNYFTVENTSGKININFASKDVLEAYLPEIADCAEDIIKYRKKKPFENITQLLKVGCISDKEYLKIQKYVTTKTHMFAVHIDVEINGTHRYATVLISRNSAVVKVLKYFEGVGFYE